MFQLIVAVIAIFLIAIMIIATLYWGGSAHSEAAVRAQYAGNMNAAAQIEGAMQLYYNEHGQNAPGSDEELLGFLKDNNYLKDIPEGAWKIDQHQIYKPFADEAQNIGTCSVMNKVAGFDITIPEIAADPWKGCPPCNGGEDGSTLTLADTYKSWPGCQMANVVTP